MKILALTVLFFSLPFLGFSEDRGEGTGTVEVSDTQACRDESGCPTKCTDAPRTAGKEVPDDSGEQEGGRDGSGKTKTI